MAIQLAGKRFEYILKEDRASEQSTVWQIMELNARQRRDLASRFIAIAPVSESATQTEIDAKNDEIFEANLSVCKAYIESAAPILGADGQPVDVSIDDILDSIKAADVIRELSLAVIEANKLNDDDKKKSATQSNRKPRS